MIRYKKYQAKRSDKFNGKWYGRAVPTGTVDLNGLSAHMAAHNTPYSTGCIAGVLKDMVSCIKELLLDGKNVKIDDLAIFSVGISSSPADTEKDLNPRTHFTFTFRARATGKLRPTTMDSASEIKAAEIDTYAKPEAEGTQVEP